MKKKNFTPNHNVAMSLVAMLLLFFISVPQQLDAQNPCPLAANDLVQVSLDQNCEATITPEMILEGEGIDCDYQIHGIWQENGTEILPTGGIPGNYVLNDLYLDQVLTARVGYADPLNLLTVEGQFYLKDKLPPVLNCLEDVYVSCAEDLSDYFDTNTNGLYPSEALAALIGPGGSIVVDITVDNQANQSELLETMWVSLNTLYSSSFTVEIFPPNLVGYVPPVTAVPFQNHDFDGQQMTDFFVDGVWSIQLTNVSAYSVPLYGVNLHLDSESFLTSQYGLVDNCSEVDEVVIISDDTEDLTDCGEFSAVRTIVMQGFDLQGLASNVCTHTVYYLRRTVLDIVWPLNRDDFQADAFNCSNIPLWDLNGDGYPQPEESGLPTVDGVEIAPNDGKAGWCEIGITYTDQVIDICPGTFKVLRFRA